jgi:hypothetical protein
MSKSFNPHRPHISVRPSLFRTLARIYGWGFFWAGLLKVMNDASIFTGPLILQEVLFVACLILIFV